MKGRKLLVFAFSLLIALTIGCGEKSDKKADQNIVKDSAALDQAAKTINEKDFMEEIKKLASDEFEGRAPASKGEELTINYLADSFKKLGLKPGNPDGTYFQKVPLVAYTIEKGAELTVSGAGKSIKLKPGDDYVGWTRRVVDKVDIDADMVFVGYGVTAPEYGWDDFKEEDVKDKVIVMLINDPQLPDEKMFGGRAMTYYGRWTYKYEQAAAKGAAGCIIIHETETAGYPWEVVRNGREGEQFTIADANNNASLAPVEGWMTFEKAQEIFKLAGLDLMDAKKVALTKEFKPIALNLKASLSLKNSIRRIESNNVVAKIEGSDPKLKDEYVIYTAHWDHFGVGKPAKDKPEDKIYNGAVDNATGTAGLIELARAFTKLPTKRSILFLAVTAEERGLLGSAHYGANPLYPLTKTVACINTDSMNVNGKTKDITVVGLGNSTLDDYVKAAATKQGRSVKPDPEPEKGYFYRSDHFNFAKYGVPALYTDPGIDYIGKPASFGEEARKKYTAEDYHKPSDEVKPDWDLSGSVEDLKLILEVGYEVANADEIPKWRDGNEFKARRDKMLAEAGNK